MKQWLVILRDEILKQAETARERESVDMVRHEKSMDHDLGFTGITVESEEGDPGVILISVYNPKALQWISDLLASSSTTRKWREITEDDRQRSRAAATKAVRGLRERLKKDPSHFQGKEWREITEDDRHRMHEAAIKAGRELHKVMHERMEEKE